MTRVQYRCFLDKTKLKQGERKINIFANKINWIISTTSAIFSTIFGRFWFLFAFLLILNVLDYITGIIKARYLKIESSKKGFEGFVKVVSVWVLILVSFGLGTMFAELGTKFDKDLSFMMCIGWFMLAHCIVNEIRSILENIVQMDKGHYVPKWLIKGLQVTQDLIEESANSFVDKLEKGVKKKEAEYDEDRETIGTQE